MNQFSPPRIIRWTSFLFLFFMLLMSAFRLFFFYYFKPSDVTFYQSLPSFRLGVRYDARVAAIILLPLLVIGSLSLRSWDQKSSKQKLFSIVLCLIPALLILLIQTDFSDIGKVVQKLILGLLVSGFSLMIIIFKDWNPFHNSRSKKFWFWWLGIASLAILLFYAFDFYYYAYLTQRLNSNLLNFMDDAGISLRMMWQSYPVVKGLLLLTVLFFAVVVGYQENIYYFQNRLSCIQSKPHHFVYNSFSFSGYLYLWQTAEISIAME